jgi:hypothetical protein
VDQSLCGTRLGKPLYPQPQDGRNRMIDPVRARFVMSLVKIDLQYCYGIRKLVHQFDFSSCPAYAIYAPNGSMKSSLAQTFKDMADGKPPTDRIFPARTSARTITDEKGQELPRDRILVLPPYSEFFRPNEKTSTLLVNNVLRQEYEKLHTDIDNSKSAFIGAMKSQSQGSKKDLEQEIALAFTKKNDENSFYVALERASIELADQKTAPFKDVAYDSIFDDKVIEMVKGNDFKTALEDYIKRYNALLAASTYFKKGVFEYYNASQIAKALADNGFFNAKHTIVLHAGKKKEISTEQELEKVIKEELDQITEDPQLKKIFAGIKKGLERNKDVRTFQQYLCDHELLLPHFKNMDQFKEDIWRSYFKANEKAFNDLLVHYRNVKARRAEIEEEARKEITQWEKAIDLFNERFFVPFTLEAKNKAAVVLTHDPILDLSYTFKDGADSTPIGETVLMASLSQGEKKALYILNIIFEIEVRRQDKRETLFVVDDIADSFDYKNKYAIIQYLQDISDGPVFKQIILTHNWDFFRTVSGRFIGDAGCLMATRDNNGIVLSKAGATRNIFVKDWKPAFFKDKKKQLASIPFMRNLIEYTHGTSDPDYLTLTSLLHWKTTSGTITQKNLDDIYNRLFGGNGASANPTVPVIDLIKQEAAACLTAGTAANFEHKIVLSIAIRLGAEAYMATKIADPAFVSMIKRNQAWALFKRFCQDFPNETIAIKTLRGVLLMTPENIHLNAFMYEPLIDIGDDHLRGLYNDVLKLK